MSDENGDESAEAAQGEGGPAADDTETVTGPSARAADDAPGDSMDHSGDADDTFATRGGEDLEAVVEAATEDDAEIDDPFAELDTERSEEDLDSLFEEAFTDASTGDLEADDVWEAIQTGSTEPAATSGEEHIVPTRDFCARCEYVANPPDPRCTYDGSEILEFVDNDHVRVRNCPIVERRNAMSGLEPAGSED